MSGWLLFALVEDIEATTSTQHDHKRDGYQEWAGPSGCCVGVFSVFLCAAATDRKPYSLFSTFGWARLSTRNRTRSKTDSVGASYSVPLSAPSVTTRPNLGPNFAINGFAEDGRAGVGSSKLAAEEFEEIEVGSLSGLDTSFGGTKLIEAWIFGELGLEDTLEFVLDEVVPV